MNELEDYAIKKVAKGGLVIFTGIILSFLAFFFYKVLAARYLGPADYGTLTLGITILNIASLFGLAGMHYSIGKFINHYLARKQYEKVKGTLILSFIITTTLSILIFLSLYFSSTFIEEKIFKIQGFSRIISIFSIGVPFSVTAQLLKYYFFAFKKPEYSIISESIAEKATNLLFLIFLIYAVASLHVITIAYVLSLIISCIVAILIFNSKIRIILAKISKPKFDFKILYFTFPLMISSIVGIAIAWTDTLLIGVFKSDVDVGVYNTAYIISSSMMILWLSFADIFYPIIAELYSKGQKALIRKVFEVTSRWIFILILPIFVTLLFFPARILSLLFGQKYISASLPLFILAIGYFFTTLFGLSEQGLITFKKTKFLGTLILLAFVGNIILNIMLIPPYGIAGAAIATTISIFITNLIKFLTFKKLIKFSCDRKLYIKTIISIAISFSIIFYALRFFETPSKYIFISGILICFVLYFALLFALRCFSEEDLSVLDAINRRIGIDPKITRKIFRM